MIYEPWGVLRFELEKGCNARASKPLPIFKGDFGRKGYPFLRIFLEKYPGGTHIFGRMGMCRSNGSLFYKKSLNMGPVFYKKILKHGSTFLTEPKFSGSSIKHGENCKIFEKWAYFSRKILKNGHPFLPKSPLKMGRGFEARAAHPCQTQIWVPPGEK